MIETIAAYIIGLTTFGVGFLIGYGIGVCDGKDLRR